MRLCTLYRWSLKIKFIVFKVEETCASLSRMKRAEPRPGFLLFLPVPPEFLQRATGAPGGAVEGPGRQGSRVFPLRHCTLFNNCISHRFEILGKMSLKTTTTKPKTPFLKNKFENHCISLCTLRMKEGKHHKDPNLK